MKADWKPVLVDGKLNPELHVGDRKLIYEKPEERFVYPDGKSTLIGIATLLPMSATGESYYWEFDGWDGHEVTLGIEFTKYWADLPELPEGE